jgi:uncharacterized SAM-binding protein YcdF (DUF218 family)
MVHDMAWLLSPLSWLLFALALAPLAWCLRVRRPWLIVVCGLLAVIAMVAMTPLVANALGRLLERSVSAPHACDESPPSVAVVLGGGVDGTPRNRTDFAVLNLASRRRVDRAVAWWREGEGRTLVMVGGRLRHGNASGAELLAAYARMLGVPDEAVRLETHSRDTWGNARNTARLQPHLPRRIVLVTSLIHMPRAQATFAEAGFEVCPLGTDVRSLSPRLPWAMIPRTSALNNTEMAIHEWVGLAYYRWRGRRESGVAATDAPDP